MSNCLTKILITGGEGQLASALLQQADAKQFELYAYSRKQLDILNTRQIDQAISQCQPDIIINTAAYTAVDKAESDVETAMAVNADGPRLLAMACKQHDIPLIHLSTDYVFDGEKGAAYQESNKTNPVNIYGESKLLGEQAIREQTDKHIILRVSGIFSEYGQNFLKTMLRLAQQKTAFSVVDDQFTCPSYAGDIADALLKIAKKTQGFGTYHFCNSNAVSWHTFATEIIRQAKEIGFNITANEISPISHHEYKTSANRPVHSILNCEKINCDYAIKQISYLNGIRQVLISLSE